MGAQTLELVRRRRDPGNGRRVLVETTRRGAALLDRLAFEHFATIEKLGRAFVPPSLRKLESRKAEGSRR